MYKSNIFKKIIIFAGRIIIFIALIVFFIPGYSQAKTLYVDGATGSDATTYAENDAGHTWDTLGRALWGNVNRSTPNASEAATAGDMVIVATGTYTAPDTGERFNVAFNPVNSGTSESNRITIRAVGTVNLATTGTQGGPVIGANNKDYITWEGFNIDENSYTSLDSGEQTIVMFADSDYGHTINNRLIGYDNDVVNGNHAAIFYHGTIGGRIYNNTMSGTRATGDNVAAIYTYGASNLLIEHNTIYDSDGGMFIKSYYNDNIIIRYNKIHDILYSGIRIGATANVNTNIVVYQNLIYNCGANAFMSYTNVGAGCKFVNNTVYNVGYGVQYHAETAEVIIYNNIFHTSTIGAAWTWATLEGSYLPPVVHDWQHNAYYAATVQWATDSGTIRDWSYWIGTWGLDTVSPSSTNGTNPLFANTAGSDFRLCTSSGVPHTSCSGSSPALALGVDILDLDGDNSTTDNIPAGAYLTGSEEIGIESGEEDIVPPASPSGLSVS